MFAAYSALNIGNKDLAKNILHNAAKSVKTVDQISSIIDLTGNKDNQLNDPELVDLLLDLPIAKCQGFDEAISLAETLSNSYKPRAYEFMTLARQYINDGFAVSRAIYVAGSSYALNDKELAKAILNEFQKSNYSFDEWYKILRSVFFDIGDDNLALTIIHKCVMAIDLEGSDRKLKFKALSDFASDSMRDIKLSRDLIKQSK